MENKSAQGWGFDLVVACSIFFMALFIFYFFAFNNGAEADNQLASLSYESERVSNSLLSEGYPKNWDSQNVASIGLMSEQKINNTKLFFFYNLSIEDYNLTRAKLGITKNYYVYFSEEISFNGEVVSGIGLSPVNEKNIIKLSRYTILNNKPVIISVEIWE